MEPSTIRAYSRHRAQLETEVTVPTLSDIAAAALELPPAERAQLAQRLMASIERDPEVEAAWDEEIRRRLAELEGGSARGIPAAEVFAAARDRLKG